MPPLVLITEHLDQPCADWLAQHAEVRWCKHDSPEFETLLPGAVGLVVRTYTQVNAALLAKAPKLRVVGRAGVGLDNVDLAACKRHKVQVVYTPDANTQAVVEYVLALMLDTLRPRPDLATHATAERFHAQRGKASEGVQLDTLTLGILGFGRIGKRLGKVASALGMKVLANDLLPEAELRKAVDYPFEFVEKRELYKRSDILTIHVDGRRGNKQLVNAGVLAQLQPNCVVINAARGMLVDNQAMADWARAHPQARVILDVHEPEPPPSSYPLYGIPNVRLLPHLASRTDTAMANMSWVVRDVAAVLEGKKPQYPAW